MGSQLLVRTQRMMQTCQIRAMNPDLQAQRLCYLFCGVKGVLISHSCKTQLDKILPGCDDSRNLPSSSFANTIIEIQMRAKGTSSDGNYSDFQWDITFQNMSSTPAVTPWYFRTIFLGGGKQISAHHQLAESAKSQFSCRDYSDHLALVRAYEGWKDAEREQSGYEYCWRNFLSAQTLRAIDSLRKQFLLLLKDASLVDDSPSMFNKWCRDENLVRAVICAGLYPGICSVVNKEKSVSLKTIEDGQVMLYSNSVNAREAKIPYPWLVFNEKVKVNCVFLRDSTAVSDSVVLLFGGSISQGGLDGHLKMLGGYLEFFMKPELAGTYLKLKRELFELIQNKLLNPKMDISASGGLLSAVRMLVTEDPCTGKFVFGRQQLKPMKSRSIVPGSSGGGGDNPKSQLQTLVTRAGHSGPTYTTKQVKNNQFRATVEFNGMQFVGQPCSNKKLAEKDAATEALEWLMGGAPSSCRDVDHCSMLLKKSKKKNHRRT